MTSTGHDFDILVVGHETEGVLAAVAAARAGARVGLVAPPGRILGGLLTEGGLAYVDRDSRHLAPPGPGSGDGIFGAFLARAGVQLVALDPERGASTLARMLAEAHVPVLRGTWAEPRPEGDRLRALKVAGQSVAARFFLDATPDGDLLELLGERFTFGFSEHGLPQVLGISPVPRVTGVTPAQIVEACTRAMADPDLEARRVRLFGARRFLDLDRGPDYVLVGPPHLALAFMRWREAQGLAPALPFEADGFNVAVLGPADTSWNGLIYFSTDAAELLDWSRRGADDRLAFEVAIFGRWMREDLGWKDAEAALAGVSGDPGGDQGDPGAGRGGASYRGVYVRQTRHLLGTRLRLSLPLIAANAAIRRAGTFAYYPDFRGLRVTPTGRPLVARVALDAGLLVAWRNVAIASRAAGYTPMAHSLCRLVQYNATLGAGLAVAMAMGCCDVGDIPDDAVRAELDRMQMVADDPTGLERNPEVAAPLEADAMFRAEAAAGVELPRPFGR